VTAAASRQRVYGKHRAAVAPDDDSVADFKGLARQLAAGRREGRRLLRCERRLDLVSRARASTLVFSPVITERGAHLSATDEPISFERHIKPLFREGDRQSMRWAFDLWSHDDVAQNSDAILERLRDGTMPCDGAWSAEQIAVFQDWVEAGTPV